MSQVYFKGLISSKGRNPKPLWHPLNLRPQTFGRAEVRGNRPCRVSIALYMDARRSIRKNRIRHFYLTIEDARLLVGICRRRSLLHQ